MPPSYKFGQGALGNLHSFYVATEKKRENRKGQERRAGIAIAACSRICISAAGGNCGFSGRRM
jgi:hypothetical protein